MQKMTVHVAASLRTVALFLVVAAATAAALSLPRTARDRSAIIVTPPVRDQLVAVLVTSAACRAADRSELAKLWEQLRDRLSARSRSEGVEFRGVGVSLDGPPTLAFKELADLGTFEEYAVGGGWTNTAVLQYVVRDVAGMPAVPQLVVVRRSVHQSRVLTVSPDSLVARFIGIEPIAKYIDRLVAASENTALLPIRGTP